MANLINVLFCTFQNRPGEKANLLTHVLDSCRIHKGAVVKIRALPSGQVQPQIPVDHQPDAPVQWAESTKCRIRVYPSPLTLSEGRYIGQCGLGYAAVRKKCRHRPHWWTPGSVQPPSAAVSTPRPGIGQNARLPLSPGRGPIANEAGFQSLPALQTLLSSRCVSPRAGLGARLTRTPGGSINLNELFHIHLPLKQTNKQTLFCWF